MGERDRRGLRARLLVRGGMGSCLVELEDGERIVCSFRALKELDD